MNFEEIYDFEKFIRSLGVVVRVAKDLPAEVSTGELKAVWVLNRASEDYMAAKIEPVFRTKRKLRLATYLPSITMRRAEDSRYSDLLAWLVMFWNSHVATRTAGNGSLYSWEAKILEPKVWWPVHRSGLEAGSVGTGVSGKRGYWTEKIVIIQRKLVCF